MLEVLRDTEAAATKKVFHELSEITGRDPLYEEAAGAAGPDPDPIYDFYGTAAEERI